jgi:uroporphyrinogen III methyltransferase/synthase
VENLIEVGRSPDTPAAVIERGTFSCQRTVTGTLGTIARIVDETEIKPPATLVVGETVLLRESLRWFDLSDRRPLLGLRVLNTRAAQDSQELSLRLRELGAEPLSLPATRIEPPDDLAPLDHAIAAIAAGSPGGSASAPAFDWIGFTSAHAVSAFMDRLLHTHAPATATSSTGFGAPEISRTLDVRVLAGTRLAAVGPATAEALGRYGLIADLVPDQAAGRHLAAALGDVAGQRILLPRSDVALRDLPDALGDRGAEVTEVVAYATRPAPANRAMLQAVLRREFDASTFFSPSAVRGLANQVAPAELAEVLRGIPAVCVGGTTAQAAKATGLTEVLTSEETSVAGIVKTLVRWRSQHQGGTPA